MSIIHHGIHIQLWMKIIEEASDAAYETLQDDDSDD